MFSINLPLRIGQLPPANEPLVPELRQLCGIAKGMSKKGLRENEERF